MSKSIYEEAVALGLRSALIDIASTQIKDFTVDNHGSILVLTPDSDQALHWCHEHLNEDAMRWGKVGYVIEPRYIADVVAGMERDGLVQS